MAALTPSLVVSNLTTYVDQITQSKFITESIFSGRTAKVVNYVTGIKGTQALNIITSTPVWTAAACNDGVFAPTGSVTLSQQLIATDDIMGQEAICQYGATSLAKYWTGALQPKGIDQLEMTPTNFATAFVADKINKNAEYVERLVWVGSKGGSQTFISGAQYALANGFLRQLWYGTGTASVIQATASTGALAVATCVDVINNMIAQIPVQISDKENYCFMSISNYRTLSIAIMNLLPGFNPRFFIEADKAGQDNWKFRWPYFDNVVIMGTYGLEGRNDIVLTPADNLYIGVDGEHDEETMMVVYDPGSNSIIYRNMFRIGTAIAYPQYVVYKKGATPS